MSMDSSEATILTRLILLDPSPLRKDDTYDAGAAWPRCPRAVAGASGRVCSGTACSVSNGTPRPRLATTSWNRRSGSATHSPDGGLGALDLAERACALLGVVATAAGGLEPSTSPHSRAVRVIWWYVPGQGTSNERPGLSVRHASRRPNCPLYGSRSGRPSSAPIARAQTPASLYRSERRARWIWRSWVLSEQGPAEARAHACISTAMKASGVRLDHRYGRQAARLGAGYGSFHGREEDRRLRRRA